MILVATCQGIELRWWKMPNKGATGGQPEWATTSLRLHAYLLSITLTITIGVRAVNVSRS